MTGIDDRDIINNAIKKCQKKDGEYEIFDVIDYLITDHNKATDTQGGGSSVPASVSPGTMTHSGEKLSNEELHMPPNRTVSKICSSRSAVYRILFCLSPAEMSSIISNTYLRVVKSTFCITSRYLTTQLEIAQNECA